MASRLPRKYRGRLRGSGTGPSSILIPGIPISGTGAIILPAGYTLTRASANDTVQSSASTVISGLPANTPRGGNNGVQAGLVIEESRTNLLINSRNLAGGSWIFPGGSAGFANGPDGAINTATRVQTPSLGAGSYQMVSVMVATYTQSRWAQNGPAGVGWEDVIGYPDGTTPAMGAAITPSAWFKAARISANALGGFLANIIYGDGRDWSAFGGTTAGARDTVYDLVQFELGAFATEAIVTAGVTVTRAGDHLSFTSGSFWVSHGRISAWFQVQPKGSSTEYSANMYLYYIDVNNYVYVSFATGAIVCAVGGVTYTTPVAMTWAAGDTLDIYVASGGGLSCLVEYRVNGGGAILLSTGVPASLGTLAPAGSIDVLNAAGADQFTAWVPQTPTIYASGQGPTWLI